MGKNKKEGKLHGGKCVHNFGRVAFVVGDQLGHLHVEELITLNVSQKNRNTINWVISLSHGGLLWAYLYAP